MKTSEMTGAALDWAVAKCENPEWSDEDAIVNVTTFDDYTGTMCNYSTDWSQGGPIIEREGIEINLGSPDKWVASIGGEREIETGLTPLIAAMRAYVASKMGEEVDVPAELED